MATIKHLATQHDARHWLHSLSVKGSLWISCDTRLRAQILNQGLPTHAHTLTRSQSWFWLAARLKHFEQEQLQWLTPGEIRTFLSCLLQKQPQRYPNLHRELQRKPNTFLFRAQAFIDAIRLHAAQEAWMRAALDELGNVQHHQLRLEELLLLESDLSAFLRERGNVR